MLHEFLSENREELAKRCRAKVAQRSSPEITPQASQHGVPVLIGQLISTLLSERGAEHPQDAISPGDIGNRAGMHGGELLRHGFSVDQVIHDYGDLCQAVTELANERKVPITVDEFHTFNRCLDNAMAEAVTEFGRQRDQAVSIASTQTMNERLGCLAHELRNLVSSATLAFQAMEGGSVGLTGATGAVLGRSLMGLSDLIDRSLADVRLTAGTQVQRQAISIRDLIDDVRTTSALEAKTRGLMLTIGPVDDALVVDADRQMLAAAIANLLQNAFKFTRPSGHVMLRVHAREMRVLIEVEDECGGLPEGKAEDLFQPFHQRSGDRTGLGLGLSISRRGVEANGGTLHVRNLPGAGCIFTIDLPYLAATH